MTVMLRSGRDTGPRGSGAWKVGMVIAAALMVASPAAAATRACPAFLPDSRFVDVDGLPAGVREAVDCVAHYGISTGSGPVTYSPADAVPRWQMALLLDRTLSALGLSPAVPRVGFGDVAPLGPEVETAVSRIAGLGITSGTGPGTFSPWRPVTRAEAAVFATRLASAAGVPLPAGAPAFGDLGGLPAAMATAVDVAARLGIVSGTAPGTFSPDLAVSRGDVAVMVARTLAVTGARPVRITVAETSASLLSTGSAAATVTVTNPSGRPVSGVLVDVFAGSILADGTCGLDPGSRLNGVDAGTSLDCRIDAADPRTDAGGRVVVGLAHDALAVSHTSGSVVAWVGEEGERFDADTVDARASATVTWTAVPSGLTIDGPHTGELGGSVTVTARLLGAGALSGQRLVAVVERGSTTVLGATLVTDATGSARLTYAGPVPGAETVDAVKVFWDRNGNGIDDGEAEPAAETTVTWKEA